MRVVVVVVVVEGVGGAVCLPPSTRLWFWLLKFTSEWDPVAKSLL